MNLIEFAKYKAGLGNQIEQNTGDFTGMQTFALASIEKPTVKVNKKYEWVEYGEANNYPKYLLDLYDSSSTHGAIVTGIGTMISGGELLVNGATKETNENVINTLSPSAKAAYTSFVSNGNGEDDIYSLKSKISLDYSIYGAFAIEVLWTKGTGQIAELRYVDVSKIRSGKKVNSAVETYWYSDNWADKKSEKTAIDAYDETSPKGAQLFYVKNHNPGQEYYGRPNYMQGIEWIDTDASLSKYHNANVQNGFNPSMSVKFYDVPDDPEKRRRIVSGIHNQFQGIKNTGKAMVFFSNDKETAPDVTPIQVNNLDKQYIALAVQCMQQILTTHRVTHPLLFGIQTAGQLGSGGDLESGFILFDNIVIESQRTVIERTLNRFLSINTQEVVIELEVFNPLA